MINCNTRTMEKLKVLSKALPKQSPRPYASVINIEGDKACVTDGYHLMYCTGIEEIEPMTVNGDFIKTDVSYPRWQAVLPDHTKSKKDLPAMEIYGLIKSLGAMTNLKNIYMHVSFEGMVSLVYSDKPESWNKDKWGTLFNPAIAVRSIKALNKYTLPQSAFMTIEKGKANGDMMQINFTNGFHIILVAIVR